MTTNSWTGGSGNQSFGGAGGSTDTNWSLNHVPTATEEASISTTNATTLTVSSSSEDVGGIAIGSNDNLDIDNAETFTTNTTGDGGTNVISGELVVNLGQFVIGAGNLQGNGVIELDSGGPVYFADLVINGSISTADTGSIEMDAASPAFDNRIETSGSGTFTNNETVSGTGIIGNDTSLSFINNGTVATTNSGSSNPGTLQITGSVGGGSFTNNENVLADNGGTLIFGVDDTASTIGNNSLIGADGEGNSTELQIAGNVTIETIGSSAPGDINLGGSDNEADDEIVSDGHAATLTLVNQTLKGAGTIGDSNLTLNNQSGTIESMGSGVNTGFVLNTGSNTITNGAGAMMLAEGEGSDLDFASPVNNAGTIEATGGGRVNVGANIGGSGAIEVGARSALSIGNATVSSNVTFTGTDGADIQLLNTLPNGGISGEIVGAQSGDVIQTGDPYSASSAVSWTQTNSGSGTLTLSNGSATVLTLNLAGQYVNGDFSVVSLAAGNGARAVEISIGNPNAPGGTSGTMIMRDGGNGDYEIYDLGGNSIQAAYALGQVGPAWQVAGVGGFDGADTSDMILRNGNNGVFELYDISNNNVTNAIEMGQVGLEWKVSGFGDFSGNPGETDMLMQDSNNGNFEVYDIVNNQITSATSMGQVGSAWTVAGFGDFSGHAAETGDMLMRNSATGAFEVYDISGNAITFAAGMGQVGLEWQVAGFGDFSGNANETDMLMRNTTTGVFEVYDISGNTITNGTSMGQVGMEWQVVGFGPINGAGSTAMLMRDTTTGAFEVYDISANAIKNATSIGQVGTEWSVAGIAADPPGGSMPANARLAQAMASYAPGASLPAADGPIALATQLSPVSPLIAAPQPS